MSSVCSTVFDMFRHITVAIFRQPSRLPPQRPTKSQNFTALGEILAVFPTNSLMHKSISEFALTN